MRFHIGKLVEKGNSQLGLLCVNVSFFDRVVNALFLLFVSRDIECCIHRPSLFAGCCDECACGCGGGVSSARVCLPRPRLLQSRLRTVAGSFVYVCVDTNMYFHVLLRDHSRPVGPSYCHSYLWPLCDFQTHTRTCTHTMSCTHTFACARSVGVSRTAGVPRVTLPSTSSSHAHRQTQRMHWKSVRARACVCVPVLCVFVYVAVSVLVCECARLVCVCVCRCECVSV